MTSGRESHTPEFSGRSERTEEDKPLFRSLVGSSRRIADVRDLIQRIARTDSTVLILGETGTGKEIAARNIHYLSDRRKRPFVAVNCAAVPHELIESELFGHERGAFTGALTTRMGRFELADGGTLFLDEIGDLRLETQVKLLRVLQERVINRLGSTESITIDARVICATHRDLETMLANGDFREDLFYRLNVVPLRMPTLRDRREDIPLLISELTARLKGRGFDPGHIGDDASTGMLLYDWPGNVRELANVIERCANLVVRREVGLEDLPRRIQQSFANHSGEAANADLLKLQELCFDLIDVENVELKGILQFVEVGLIRRALEKTGGVVTQAANQLGMRRSTLVDRMRKFGIDP